MRSARLEAQVLIVGLLGLGIALAYGLRILIPAGMDPSSFLALGKDAPRQTAYAKALLGDVVVREALGHDGKFFFAQANDPWFLAPQEHAAVLDRPSYRGQRMAYPTLASGLGLLPPKVVVWTLPSLNVLAIAIGTVGTALLARRIGSSPWLGLAFPLNLGVLSELDIDGAGALALMFGVLGVLSLEIGRLVASAVWMSAAVLSREVMLAFVAGVCFMLWRRRRRIPWWLVAVPTTAVLLWAGYVRLRLGNLPTEANRELASYPFQGLIAAVNYWRTEVTDLLVILVLIALTLAFTVRAVRSKQLLAWGALPMVALATMLSVYVWREPYDIARALAPIFTAYPILLFTTTTREHVFD